MTLIVGIVCKDGIVLAADSQTTKGASKQPATEKISVIKFSDGKALVAESGSASLSNRAVEVFKVKAAGVKVEDEMTIARVAQSAVREIRDSLTALHPANTSPKDWQDFFWEEINYFELMVAYYFLGRPYLYKLNPLWCVPVPLSGASHFMTSGIAESLANYILSEHTAPKMDSALASVIAIKVVEDAIKYVEGCGGATRVAVIKSPVEIPSLGQPDRHPLGWGMLTDPVDIYPREKVVEIAEIISSVESKSRASQKDKIHSALRQQTKRFFKRLLKTPIPRELCVKMPSSKK